MLLFEKCVRGNVSSIDPHVYVSHCFKWWRTT